MPIGIAPPWGDDRGDNRFKPYYFDIAIDTPIAAIGVSISISQ